jgi:pimeloyl-ACP methyl ester carboxylesterase
MPCRASAGAALGSRHDHQKGCERATTSRQCPAWRGRVEPVAKKEQSLTILDRPDVLRVIFHPRPDYSPTTATSSVRSVSVEVERGVSVGGRLYEAGPDAPAILLWHGNGEIAADYDALGPMYVGLGITLLVVDYRGYGNSDGSPTCSNLLADALALFRAADGILQREDLAPSRLFVMGRSLGSAAAIEVASTHGARLAGLIVESGFSDTFSLLARLGVHVSGVTEASDGFGSALKMERVTIPTLIIHGENDVLIPAADGRELFRRSGAEDKRLLLIPGAGHNDLMLVARAQYFEAIRRFVFGESGGRDS